MTDMVSGSCDLHPPTLSPFQTEAAETRTPGRRSQLFVLTDLCSPTWPGVRRFSGYLSQNDLEQKSSGALAGQVPSGTNICRREMDQCDAAYLGHADDQVPCGLRPFSKTAVRFDFCREDELKRLGADRRRGR